MTTLVLDLETVDPNPPEDGKVLPTHHEIVAIGCLTFDGARAMRLGLVAKGKSEDEQVRALVRYLDVRDVTIVTWYGRGFDLPLLVARCAHYGIPCPKLLSNDVRYRYAHHAHFDLCDYLGGYGASHGNALDTWARLVGLPGKGGVNGSNVAGMVQRNEWDAIERYCLSDVAQTGALWLHVEYLRGNLPLFSYLDGLESLRALAPWIDEKENDHGKREKDNGNGIGTGSLEQYDRACG